MNSETAAITMNQDATAALVPKLRFPEFRGEEEWTLTAGNSLFAQIKDRNPEPGLPVLAITQEHGAIPRHMIDYHVSVTEKSMESYKVVQVGDFIISLRSFQGGIEYSRYHGICSPAYVILRRRVRGSDEYFRHYLKTDGLIRILTRNLEGLRDGKMISYAQFSELLLPIPGHDEQTRIAGCLNSLDELIAAQVQKVEVLKTHKKGLMQQLFPREGETQPRVRFPEFQNAGEWEEVALGDIAEIKLGKMLDKQKHTSGHLLPYLNNMAVRWNEVNTSDLPKMYFNDRELDRFGLRAGDVVVCEGGEPGRAAVWDGRLPDLKFQKAIHRVRFNVPFEPKILVLHLENLAGTDQFEMLFTGGGIKHLTGATFAQLKTPLFPLAEQQRIASCLSNLDAMITAETKRLEALKTHKKGLMQQLFPSQEEVEA
jgi:type I restriction enzyme S subunit